MARLVSVIIPTYNREDYIVEALQSVLKQKLPVGFSMEVIVVDDGSTDNTPTLLRPFKSQIKYVKIPNSGRPAVARNTGIKLAKGEFIAFQDSDDIWTSDKLKSQLPTFEDKGVVLSYGNAEFMSMEGKRSGRTIISNKTAPVGYIFDQLITTNFISTLTVIVRRKAILEVGCFNESWKLRGIEDYELWLRMSQKGKVAFVPKVLALYRQHDKNISPSDPRRSYRDLLNVYAACLRNRDLDRNKRKLVYSSRVTILTALKEHSTFKPLISIRILCNRLRRKFL